MLWFLIGMSVSLSKGLSLFGGSYGEETSQTPGNMDYIILAFAIVLNVLLIAIFIYHMFFSKIEPIGPQDKVIIKGRIVETKMEQDHDQDESDKSN